MEQRAWITLMIPNTPDVTVLQEFSTEFFLYSTTNVGGWGCLLPLTQSTFAGCIKLFQVDPK
jgi:hypothetical protein